HPQSGSAPGSYTAPGAFTDSIDIPSVVPTITNDTWKNGSLGLDPASAVIHFTNPPEMVMTWEIVGGGGSAGGGGTSTGTLDLSGMLGYGQTYQAQIRFIHTDHAAT